MMQALRSAWRAFRARSVREQMALVGLMGGVGVMVLITGSVGMIELTSTPTFCRSCHVMRPYYETWKHSAHNGIACIQCHIPPGLETEIHKKIEALNMVVGYFTRTWGDNPWAVVEDAACLRCHSKARLSGDKLFRGARFDHTPHLLYEEEGLKLRCTSCHAQVLRDEHVWVDPRVCFLCHLRDDASSTMRDCQTCHVPPDTVFQEVTVRFNHGRVRTNGMACQWCHGSGGEGDGRAQDFRCIACHNRSEVLQEFEDVPRVHRIHLHDTKVDCIACHTPVEHTPGKALTRHATPTEDQDILQGWCASCHGVRHGEIPLLYAGQVQEKGGFVSPDPMAQVGVACETCHALDARVRGLSCMACHDARFVRILDNWEEALQDARSRILRALARRGQKKVQAMPSWMLSHKAGLHNIRLTLRLAHRMYERLRRGTDLPPWEVFPAELEEPCGACHARVARRVRANQWVRPFDHGHHVQPALGLGCTDCHRSHEEKPRGEVLRPELTCRTCHHTARLAATTRCRTCHARLPEEIQIGKGLDFPHAFHYDPDGAERLCQDCHEIVSGKVRWDMCLECHDPDELPGTGMARRQTG